MIDWALAGWVLRSADFVMRHWLPSSASSGLAAAQTGGQFQRVSSMRSLPVVNFVETVERNLATPGWSLHQSDCGTRRFQDIRSDSQHGDRTVSRLQSVAVVGERCRGLA